MAYKTIKIIGPSIVKNVTISGTPLPGMLMEETSTARTYQAHATAGGSANCCILLEDEEQGQEIGTAYTTGNEGKVGYFQRGEEFYGRILDGETVVVGSKLESGGSGYLRLVDADPSVGTIGIQSIVATAKEAVDMSGSSGADPSGLCLCEAW